MHKNVLFVAFPQMCLLDMSGPQTVFWAATKEQANRGRSGYCCHTVSVGGGFVRTAEGVEINSQPLSDFDHESIDTVMIPGSFYIDRLGSETHEVIAWLKRTSLRARRMTSVCTGAFFLARAGLLQGKRAATHWMICDAFQQQFPEVHVDRESLFVQQDSLWTSAGVTAGIDMAMALVEEDYGREISMSVAQELVVFLKRPGGQAQFSQLLRIQAQESDLFDDLHLWIMDNLADDALTVEKLAERVFMSPRNFARVYKNRTGRSPAKAVEAIRVEAARRMLDEPIHSVSQIARLCGFGDEQRMRTAFLRNLSVTPSEYRKRFSSTAAPISETQATTA